jgi:hypothetical protein
MTPAEEAYAALEAAFARCGQHYILVKGVVTRCENLLEWGTWMESSPDRVVAVDRNEGDGPDGTHVSTVFMGINLRMFREDEPPVCFETMVFGGVLDGAQQRYATLVEAMAGHQAMCRRVMETES